MKNSKINQSILKLFLSITLILTVVLSNAQIKVESNGSVLIGNKLSISTTIGPTYINPMTGLGYIGNIYQFEQIRSASFWSYQYQVTSDKRLKTNIKSIDKPLDKVLLLNGKKYDYIPDATDSIGSDKEKQINRN